VKRESGCWWAASAGVIYGYDMSNIAGALLYIADEFPLSTNLHGC
jgi:hypothetical protein